MEYISLETNQGVVSTSQNQNNLNQKALSYPSYALTNSQLSELELLLSGALKPLTGYLGQAEYSSVLNEMRLSDQSFCPMPLGLEVPSPFAEKLSKGHKLALRDPEGFLLAVLKIEEIWQPDYKAEARAIWGLDDPQKHPMAKQYLNKESKLRLSGPVQGVALPKHHDFHELRSTPFEICESFSKNDWQSVMGCFTRKPMHRLQFEQTRFCARKVDARIALMAEAGQIRVGDITHYARIRSYEKLLGRYPRNMALLNLLPLSYKAAGPREALWHAVIFGNFGLSHMLVTKNYGDCNSEDANSQNYYQDWEAFEVLEKNQDQLKVKPVACPEMAYSQKQGQFLPLTEIDSSESVANISSQEINKRLELSSDIYEWVSFPEVLAELQKAYPPRSKQGFTIFLTGLSGSGKSTLAKVLVSKFLELGDRAVTLLDGDLVRRHLSSELNFSKEHRDINIKRIGFVASEITKNGGIAVCAPIAPYEEPRGSNRELIGSMGGYIEVYVSTSLEVCEQRDPKGAYAKARKGLIKGFTGIDDPYEVPEKSEIVVDCGKLTPNQAAQKILLYLSEQGYIG